jgi:hypothetical protein
MTDYEQYATIRSLSLSLLAELRAEPKPSYTLAGQHVSWTEYAESLQRTIDWCDRKLQEVEPFEIRSQGTT